MVIVANEPPYSVCILRVSSAPDCHSRPAPRGTGRIEHLKQLLASSSQLLAKQKNFVIPSAARKLGFTRHPVFATRYYLFENWKRFLAPFWPYFLRSLPRESRVTRPSAFSLPRSSALNC